MSQIHTIEVEGVKLCVEVSGEGPAVLFGHSLLCDRTMFQAQVADLSQDYQVINIDFRGHGQSETPKMPYTIGDQAEDYRRVMDALKIGKAVIVGLSMGGMAAMHLALRHPDRVAGLVLLNTSAGLQEPRRDVYKFLLLAYLFRWIGFHPLLQVQVAALMFGKTFRQAQPGVVRQWMEKIGSQDKMGLLRAVRMVTSRPCIEARLAEIKAPALVIAGAEDKATPPALAKRITANLPVASLHIMEATGHLSTIEQPEKTTQLIRGALAAWKW